uniref:Cns1/TTC4 wheel domain-containing protein n=1 Tax=Saimiri boliviensis boliviensis TaxID=39432 RepID=A0A2K6T5X9_SAIBB
MKKAPSKIDLRENPDLACLQSSIFNEEHTSEEQTKSYKDEGNDYLKEKDHKKAAAAQYYLGNFRSALSDVTAARKLKPCYLKAIIGGAFCHLELKHCVKAVNWCDKGLQTDAKQKKLLEMRAKVDKLKQIQQRDVRKANLKEKKEKNQNEALLQAIKARNIKLCEAACEDEDSASEGLGELFLDGLSSENPYRTKLKCAQLDFISAFHEDSRFIDHLMVIFGDTPFWDLEQKYGPDNLEICFEDEDRAELTLLQVLQHHRNFVKALTPAFLVCVGSSPFCRNYLWGRKVHQIR